MHETGIRPANNFRVDKARRWPDGPIYCGRPTSQQGSASSQHTHKFEAKKKKIRKEKKKVWWQTPCIIYIQHGWKKSDGTLASVFLEIGRERPGRWCFDACQLLCPSRRRVADKRIFVTLELLLQFVNAPVFECQLLLEATDFFDLGIVRRSP